MSEDQQGADDEAHHRSHACQPCEGPLPVAGRQESVGGTQGDCGVSQGQANQERDEYREAGKCASRIGSRQDHEHLGWGFGADPVEHAYSDGGLRGVVGERLLAWVVDVAVAVSWESTLRSSVLAFVVKGGECAVCMRVRHRLSRCPRNPGACPDVGAARRAQHEHPAAAKRHTAPVTNQCVSDVHTQQDERPADHDPHGGVGPSGQVAAGHYGDRPDEENNERMPGDIERAEDHAAPRRLLGGGDVTDSGEVIPIDAVSQAEKERGGDEPECDESASPVN